MILKGKAKEDKRKTKKEGNASVRRIPLSVGLLVLAVLVLALLLAAACIGSAHLSVKDALRLLGSRLPGIGRLVDTEGIGEVYGRILFQVRLPRVILAGLVGAGLSVTGAAFQGLFRNPLADPHILGVSSGAALGATLAMLFGAGGWFGGISLTG
ncbi:MAG: iron ABC transporter permease, partial [Lachnospiraceae bacterium]|nr:iron ABC transporter permease [Lachnospiraceae bacterium]